VRSASLAFYGPSTVPFLFENRRKCLLLSHSEILFFLETWPFWFFHPLPKSTSGVKRSLRPRRGPFFLNTFRSPAFNFTRRYFSPSLFHFPSKNAPQGDYPSSFPALRGSFFRFALPLELRGRPEMTFFPPRFNSGPQHHSHPKDQSPSSIFLRPPPPKELSKPPMTFSTFRSPFRPNWVGVEWYYLPLPCLFVPFHHLSFLSLSFPLKETSLKQCLRILPSPFCQVSKGTTNQLIVPTNSLIPQKWV